MFFGIFGKEKKEKKSHIPAYDSKLIKKFHKDHKHLVSRIGEIKNALSNNQITKAKEHLIHLKMDILGHFMEEDIKLYWYLNDYYKEEVGVSSMIKTFESSIKEIQKEVIRFLDHYAHEDTVLDLEFNRKFDAIIAQLAARIESEEANLYTLYVND